MELQIKQVQLKPEVIESIKKSLACKNALQFGLGKSYDTVQRWLKENNSKLTEVTPLNIIADALHLTVEELTEEKLTQEA